MEKEKIRKQTEHNNDVAHHLLGHHHIDTSLIFNISSRLFFVIFLNVLIIIGEIIASIISGSLAILSDSLHNLTDVGGLIISFVAIKLSAFKKTPKKTFGYKRAEVLGGFINSILILGISVSIFVEGIKSFITPREVSGLPVIVVATSAFVLNFLSALFLRKDIKHNISLKGAFFHLLSDSLTSLGVVLSGVLILLTKNSIYDSIITVIISLLIFKTGFELIKETSHILLEAVPDEIELETVKNRILKIEGVKEAHHIHIWKISSGLTAMSCHILTDIKTISESQILREKIQKILNEKFNINHATIEFENTLCSGEAPC